MTTCSGCVGGGGAPWGVTSTQSVHSGKLPSQHKLLKLELLLYRSCMCQTQTGLFLFICCWWTGDDVSRTQKTPTQKHVKAIKLKTTGGGMNACLMLAEVMFKGLLDGVKDVSERKPTNSTAQYR